MKRRCTITFGTFAGVSADVMRPGGPFVYAKCTNAGNLLFRSGPKKRRRFECYLRLGGGFGRGGTDCVELPPARRGVTPRNDGTAPFTRSHRQDGPLPVLLASGAARPRPRSGKASFSGRGGPSRG